MSSYQDSVNYYTVLGVPRDASTKEINLAFKRRALKLHPDKSGGDRASIDQFCLTQEAVETLRDPERRRHHDESLSRASININHERKGQSGYNGTCAAPNKYEKSQWNNGSLRNSVNPQYTSRTFPNEYSGSHWNSGSPRNPFKPQYTSRDAPNRNGSGEWHKESEESSPREKYKSPLHMWGPAIHAYSIHPPRPILKSTMTIRQLNPTNEGKGESKPEPAASEPGTEKAPTELHPDKVQTLAMQDQQAEETVNRVADAPDATSNEPLDNNGNSITDDSTDYESLDESWPDDTVSSHIHSWVASGYDSDSEDSEDGGVPLPLGYWREAQTGEDDTLHTMYFDCSEHLATSSTDEESTDDETEEDGDDNANENTNDGV